MESSKVKLIVLVVIALLAVGAAGYFWYQLQGQKAENKASSTTVENSVSSTPIYISLKPFTLSMPGVRNGYDVNKVLFVGLALRVPNTTQEAIIREYLPEVRSTLLLLLSSQSIDSLEEESGRLELKELVKQTLSRFYNQKAKVMIDDVLYTDFIIR